METKSRRPLQPRDSNAPASPLIAAGKASKAKVKPRLLPPSASPPSVKSYVKDEPGAGLGEVSLAEELQKVRERRGRIRAAWEKTEQRLQAWEAVLEREAREWERKADEQRGLVSELMRLIGMPEMYTPVESLRSKEQKKQRAAHSDSAGFELKSFDIRERR